MRCLLYGLVLLIATAAYSQEHPPLPKRDHQLSTQQSVAETTGTEERPFVVKINPTEGDKLEAENREKERQDRARGDRDLVYWTRVLAALAFLQFAALVIHALIFRAQAREMNRTVNSAEAAFNKVERPWLFITVAPEWRPGESVHDRAYVEYSAENFGRTPVIVDNVLHGITVTDTGVPDALRADDAHPLFVSPVMGQHDRQPDLRCFPALPTTSALVGEQTMSRGDILFLVVVQYHGPFTKGHETSVCRRFDIRSGRLVPYGRDDYNYEK